MITEEQILSSKILIVDDEPANVSLMDEILQENGFFQTKITTDPRDAIDLYQDYKPDLILLDIRMPYMDGFQVMNELKKLNGSMNAPILILTAQNDKQTRIQALEKGAKDFLLKPFEIDETLCRIKNLLETHLLNRQILDRNKILNEKVKERTQELKSTRLSIIHRLGRAGEYRDNETGMHVIRMSKYSMEMGKKLNMNEKETDLLLHASPMHDIGKIGIPDNILLKPGKLDEAEWKIMKTHTTIGGDLLSGDESALLQLSLTIALEHHEKWDGSGYPNGLKGEEISIEGRIVALCDVFDALTSNRPYKKAWPDQEALEYIQSNSGKQFDPQLTTAFTEIMPEVLKLKVQYSD